MPVTQPQKVRLTETARSMRAIGPLRPNNKLGKDVWNLLDAGANAVSNLIVTRMEKEQKKCPK